MAARKNDRIHIPVIKVKKGESLKSIYAKVRRAFTAADLQRYTEIEPMIPAEQVLAEMEEIHRREMQKGKRAKR